MSIRIFLADDHQMVREGLRTLLAQQADFDVVGEATDGLSTVAAAIEMSPVIVLMDVAMPGLNGIEATRQIVNADTGNKVIALSVHDDKRYVLEMLRAGAHGYVLKANAFKELIHAINAVQKGHTYLCPEIAHLVVGACLEQTSAGNLPAYSMLTTREREVLTLLAEGRTAKEIAGQLFISSKTVDVHRQNIMTKLHLSSLADLVKYAIKEGLVILEN